MYVSDDFKFVYFGPSKNASTSIISTLVTEFNAVGVSVSDKTDSKAWPLGPHHSAFLPHKYKDYFKFTSVRNPFDRSISWYNFLPSRDATRFVGDLTFGEFIKEMCNGSIQHNWRLDCWKHSQKQLIFGQPLRNQCVPVEIDRVIKVENLNEDFNSLPFVDRKIIIGTENATSETRQKSFPIGLASMFAKRFAEDFEYFNYSTAPVTTYY